MRRSSRLLERRLQADGVERHVEHRGRRWSRRSCRVARGRGRRTRGRRRVERAVENGGLDVHRDDRRGADQAGQLHDVGAEPADAPHPDGLADADLAGAHHRAERRRHRVGQDGGLFERDVVGHPGQPERPARRCTRPMRRHMRTPSTARAGSSSCRRACNWRHVVQGRPAATITRSPSAQPVTPAPSLAMVPGCLVALRHHRQLRREGTVDEAEVGMADPAERDLDEDLARAGLGVSEYPPPQLFWSRHRNARPASCQPFRSLRGHVSIGPCAGCSGCMPINGW